MKIDRRKLFCFWQYCIWYSSICHVHFPKINQKIMHFRARPTKRFIINLFGSSSIEPDTLPYPVICRILTYTQSVNVSHKNIFICMMIYELNIKWNSIHERLFNIFVSKIFHEILMEKKHISIYWQKIEASIYKVLLRSKSLLDISSAI